MFIFQVTLLEEQKQFIKQNMKELESVSEEEKQEEDEKEQDGKKDDGVVKALSGERNNPFIPQKEILNKFSLMVRSLFCRCVQFSIVLLTIRKTKYFVILSTNESAIALVTSLDECWKL